MHYATDEQAHDLAVAAVRRAPEVGVTTYVNTDPAPYTEPDETAVDTASLDNHDHWQHVDGEPVAVPE